MPSAVLGSPKDQFPIISKKVRWRASPTSSMSPVRTHFWILAILFPPGCSSPNKYGTKGCIPAVVKSAVGSVSPGTREDDGMIECPLSLKNSKNFFLISLERMSQQRDLNPRPTVYKTVALPLSYAGLSSFLSLESAPLT